jgi:23S rRNA (cytosine1962-C5)-methyltransferase
MLNCFAYTGGFAVAALKAGAAHVVNIDASAPPWNWPAPMWR